jgi:AraC-like DNA-binding protein
MYCSKTFDVYFVHFNSRVAGGLELFNLLDCRYQAQASQREYDMFQRIVELNPNAGLRDYDAHKPPEQIVKPHREIVIDGGDLARHIETDGLVRLLLVPFVQSARNLTAGRLVGLPRIAPVIRWIEKHLDQPITLQTLAARVHLNPTYFSDLFAGIMGIRPIAYINRRRMERAQALLLTTHRSIKEIAAELGFGNTAYFCRLFKQHCGQSPRPYREHHEQALAGGSPGQAEREGKA